MTNRHLLPACTMLTKRISNPITTIVAKILWINSQRWNAFFMHGWKKFRDHRKLRQAVFRHFWISLWALQNTGWLRIQFPDYTYISLYRHHVSTFLLWNGQCQVAVLCEIFHEGMKPVFLCFQTLKYLNFLLVNVSCLLLEIIPFTIWKTKWGYLIVRLHDATSAEPKNCNSAAASWGCMLDVSDGTTIVILDSRAQESHLKPCQTAFWTSWYLHLYEAEKSKTA